MLFKKLTALTMIFLVSFSGFTSQATTYTGRDRRVLEINDFKDNGETKIKYDFYAVEEGQKRLIWTRTYSIVSIGTAVIPEASISYSQERDTIKTMIVSLGAVGISVALGHRVLGDAGMRFFLEAGLVHNIFLAMYYGVKYVFPGTKNFDFGILLNLRRRNENVRSGQDLGHLVLRALNFIECGQDLKNLRGPEKHDGPPSLDDVLN